MLIFRVHVAGVVEAPWGAHFTGCAPYYRADVAHIQEYMSAAQDPQRWQEYLRHYVLVSEEERLANLGGVEGLIGRLRV